MFSHIRQRLLAPLILCMLSLLGSGSAFGQSLAMYLSPPGVQDTSRAGALVETFDRGAGSLAASGSWAIGTFSAASGGLSNAGLFGGAGGTGQYLKVGSSLISVMLSGGNRRYVGFWWSAGDPTNVIRFYDSNNNLLAQFTTANLANLLSGSGTVTAIDGNQYPKASYYGNPNPPAGRNPGEPYGYINLLLQGSSVTFGRIEIEGTNFELDNLAIADPVPIDTGWVDLGTQGVNLPAGAVGAADDKGTTPVNTPFRGNAATNDTAPAGSIWTRSSAPANGSVAFNADGSYVYTPAPGFIGVDTFTYQVCKPAPDQATCAPATVRITVGVDAVDDATRTTPGTPVTDSVPNNDLFPAGTRFTVSSSPSHGTVTMNPSTGVYVYTPGSGFIGTDTFQYRLCLPAPNQTQCDTATVTVTISPNAAPVASNVSISGVPQAGVSLTGSYAYSDAEADVQSTSTFRWVRNSSSASPAGGFTVDTGSSYTPTNADAGQYLFFCVTPRAQTGTTPGAEVCSVASATGSAGGPAAPVLAGANSIPALSEGGLLLLSLLLAACAAATLCRRGV